VHTKQMPFLAAGWRVSGRAVKGAGVGRSLERKRKPLTEGAGGSGAGFSQEGQLFGIERRQLRQGRREVSLTGVS